MSQRGHNGGFAGVDDFADFLAMGGYAAYVWPALAIAAGVLIALTVAGIRRLRRSEAELRAAEALGGRRRHDATRAEKGT